jgi:diacylglycerol kinase family enzyme
LRLNYRVPGIDLVHADRVLCESLQSVAGSSPEIYVEADGELLGTLPADICMVPDALTVLTPTA